MQWLIDYVSLDPLEGMSDCGQQLKGVVIDRWGMEEKEIEERLWKYNSTVDGWIYLLSRFCFDEDLFWE